MYTEFYFNNPLPPSFPTSILFSVQDIMAVQGPKQCNMLHYACEVGSYKVAHLLLKRGCSRTAEDQRGLCPYRLAIKHFRYGVYALTMPHRRDESFMWLVRMEGAEGKEE